MQDNKNSTHIIKVNKKVDIKLYKITVNCEKVLRSHILQN